MMVAGKIVSGLQGVMRCRLMCLLLFLCQPGYGQNKTMDGYKGIWFTLGQRTAYGDKYSGGLGTYTSSHVPVAIFDQLANKTFFVYGGTTATGQKQLLIMISYFDHANNKVPKPVVVYDKQGVDDPHDNAAMAIDEKGFLFVFVSGRNTSRPGLIFKSAKPRDITRFIQLQVADFTYPQPWFSQENGFTCLFTRYTRGRELYWNNSSDGNNWTPAQKLAGFGGHYQVSQQQKGRLITAFNYHPGGDVNRRTNVYFVQSNDGGKQWLNISGKPVNTPLTSVLNDALVKNYEAAGKLVYLNDISFDAAGNPVILAVISNHYAPGPAGDPREWVVIHWKHDAWVFTSICSSTHNYDMGSIYIDGNQWRMIGPTGTGPQPYGTGGEMELWESGNNGVTWSKTRQLTFTSTRNHSYARRPLNAHENFYSFWADGDADQFSDSRLYFCNKKGDVWELPYDMDSLSVHPVQKKQ